LRFTRDCESALATSSTSAASLAALQQELNDQLVGYTSTQVDTSQVLASKLKALILDLIHHIDVIDQLMRDTSPRSIASWCWQKQLRVYLDAQQQVVMRMVDAEYRYTYEYQGNAPKLVHTPLTDKCYLTMTQGIQFES
jgi:dynein heavy chain 2